MIFDIKEVYNFDSQCIFVYNATNIPQQLKTGFVQKNCLFSAEKIEFTEQNKK